MTHYLGVVGKDPGTLWGVWFPDVPGCHAASDDDEDILEMASDALRVHLDGEKLPRARSTAEILKLDEVRKDLANGDFLISVPLLLSGGRTKRVTITGEAHMINAIDKAAQQHGVTRSAFLMEAARQAIVGADVAA